MGYETTFLIPSVVVVAEVVVVVVVVVAVVVVVFSAKYRQLQIAIAHFDVEKRAPTSPYNPPLPSVMGNAQVEKTHFEKGLPLLWVEGGQLSRIFLY